MCIQGNVNQSDVFKNVFYLFLRMNSPLVYCYAACMFKLFFMFRTS